MVKLTVYFEEPFWVGVFESIDLGYIKTSKVVFGKEPKDYEVYEFILKSFYKLKFSEPVIIDESREKLLKPKKMKKFISSMLEKKGVGTKAQQAIKLEHETRKLKRKIKSKEIKEKERELKFNLRQEKKKQKKRGH